LFKIKTLIIQIILASIIYLPLSAVETKILTQKEKTEKYIKILPAILHILFNENKKPFSIEGNINSKTSIYALYQFLPTVNNRNYDILTFSIQNKPTWAEFNTTTGLLGGRPSDEGNYTNIIISVSDGTDTTSLDPFYIEVNPAIDIAHKYGKATQGTDSSYGYYAPASNAIDNNDSTYNHTRGGKNAENWLQIELPNPTKIHKIVIQNRGNNEYRLTNAKVYLLDTPYIGIVDENDFIKTLEATLAEQNINLNPAKSGRYLLIKGETNSNDQRHLHLRKVEVYGEIPSAPAFIDENTVFRVAAELSSTESVGSVIAQDYQNDTLGYSIVESGLPFSIDENGLISVTSELRPNHTYHFHVSVSDGVESTSSWVTIVTDKNEQDYYSEMLDYSSEYNITNNMQGDLAGQLWFMQSQMHRPKAKGGEFRPLAVAFRSALLLFMIKDATSIHAIEMKVTNDKGEVYTALLSKPSKIGLCDQSTADSRAKLTFSKRSWTGEIPWNFMTPKMSIELTELDSSGTEQKSASLNAGEIKLGTPHEIMINNIDLGMLVEPRGANEHVYSKYNKTAEYALNYFQTAPIAKYTIGRYAPAYFPKVVLDDGTVYTDKSASTNAGVYSGDMRGIIAKALVSTGINKANIGLISDKSQDDRHDRIMRQTLVHTAQGKYTHPDTGEAVTVVHGLSGGAGKLTLVDVSGNEFSHEYGHDHGMGHYPGGIYAIHNYESGWSYNTYLNRFIGNLRWKSIASSVSNPNTEESVAPFKNLYSYGKDSMGSGNPNESLFSKFTFYTPYTAYYIQQNLAQSGMIDDSSPTGYSQWNGDEEKYEPKSVIYPKPTQTKIPVMTLLGFYDPQKSLTTFIYPALYSNYGSYFSSEVLNARNTDDTCKIVLTKGDNTEESYNLLSTRKVSTRMNQFQLNLPLSGNYKKAKVVCDNTELDSRDIAPLTFNLKEPVIIGKEYGMKMALKQMRLFSEVFANTNFATNKKFVEAFNTHYASLKSYTEGVRVEEGDSFVLGTKYFIALGDNLDAPSEESEDWLYLGDSQFYIKLEKLALGEVSEDFTEKFGSSTYFLVPVDNERVLSSNAVAGAWYSSNITQITVQAINKSTGEKQPIVIGGTVGGSPIQAGRNYDSSSVLKFFFKKEDNPTLAKGEYAVSFYTTGRRWHASDVTLNLLIEGTVVVD